MQYLAESLKQIQENTKHSGGTQKLIRITYERA